MTVMKRYSFLLLNLLTLHLLTVSVSPEFALAETNQTPSYTPPGIFIDKDACPYEGCFYGFWRVESDFPLFDKINSDHIIGIAKKGSNIKSLTGEVHTLPDILKIKASTLPTDRNNPNHYAVNHPVYVLTYLGEGFFRVWYEGRFYEDDAIYCAVPSMGVCTPKLDIYDVVRPGKRVWWIKIQLANKKTGWAKSTDSAYLRFSHADLYGGEPQLKGFYDKSK
ncbi:MAG: hypothetical protein K2X01_03305 [Cyanobacteria bacterium]|nr:hypothetical protein [Cyanobacteriota bacterium]